MKVAIYIRVSSEEQTKDFSLMDQEKALLDYAKSKDLHIKKSNTKKAKWSK